LKTFNCPQCGASLEFERIDSPLVRCHYCASQVVVPAELRPTPSAPRVEKEPLPPDGGDETPKKVALAVVLLLLLAGGIGLLIANNNHTSNPNRTAPVPPYTPRTQPTPTPKLTPKPDGFTVVYTFGGEGTGPGLFKDDMGVAVDADGRVYVSDETRRVQRFDPSGSFLNTWNIPAETKWYAKLRGGPSRLLVNNANQLYAVLGGVILKLDGETGEVLGAAHGSDYIHDAAVAPGGGLLVVSQKGEDDELVLMGADGRAARRTHRFVSSQLDKRLEVEALRVAADGAGQAYALYAIGGVSGEHWYDNEDIAVFKFAPDGKYLARFGGEGREPGQYGPPTTFAVDSAGRAYVCESFDKIHVFAPDGRFVRTLKSPHAVESLTFDAQNNLYVAGGYKVSKLVLDK
jgi:DNA-directed RNA polymerase subunit RPC12/RpoP